MFFLLLFWCNKPQFLLRGSNPLYEKITQAQYIFRNLFIDDQIEKSQNFDQNDFSALILLSNYDPNYNIWLNSYELQIINGNFSNFTKQTTMDITRMKPNK